MSTTTSDLSKLFPSLEEGKDTKKTKPTNNGSAHVDNDNEEEDLDAMFGKYLGEMDTEQLKVLLAMGMGTAAENGGGGRSDRPSAATAAGAPNTAAVVRGSDGPLGGVATFERMLGRDVDDVDDDDDEEGKDGKGGEIIKKKKKTTKKKKSTADTNNTNSASTPQRSKKGGKEETTPTTKATTTTAASGTKTTHGKSKLLRAPSSSSTSASAGPKGVGKKSSEASIAPLQPLPKRSLSKPSHHRTPSATKTATTTTTTAAMPVTPKSLPTAPNNAEPASKGDGGGGGDTENNKGEDEVHGDVEGEGEDEEEEGTDDGEDDNEGNDERGDEGSSKKSRGPFRYEATITLRPRPGNSANDDAYMYAATHTTTTSSSSGADGALRTTAAGGAHPKSFRFSFADLVSHVLTAEERASCSTAEQISEALALTKVVDLSGKGLAESDDLFPLDAVTHLYLQRNTLREVEAVAALSHLTVLVISHNSLTSLAPLATLDRLLFLDAAHNDVAELDVGAHLPCDSLVELRLQGNPCAPDYALLEAAAGSDGERGEEGEEDHNEEGGGGKEDLPTPEEAEEHFAYLEEYRAEVLALCPKLLFLDEYSVASFAPAHVAARAEGAEGRGSVQSRLLSEFVAAAKEERRREGLAEQGGELGQGAAALLLSACTEAERLKAAEEAIDAVMRDDLEYDHAEEEVVDAAVAASVSAASAPRNCLTIQDEEGGGEAGGEEEASQLLVLAATGGGSAAAGGLPVGLSSMQERLMEAYLGNSSSSSSGGVLGGVLSSSLRPSSSSAAAALSASSRPTTATIRERERPGTASMSMRPGTASRPPTATARTLAAAAVAALKTTPSSCPSSKSVVSNSRQSLNKKDNAGVTKSNKKKKKEEKGAAVNVDDDADDASSSSSSDDDDDAISSSGGGGGSKRGAVPAAGRVGGPAAVGGGLVGVEAEKEADGTFLTQKQQAPPLQHTPVSAAAEDKAYAVVSERQRELGKELALAQRHRDKLAEVSLMEMWDAASVELREARNATAQRRRQLLFAGGIGAAGGEEEREKEKEKEGDKATSRLQRAIAAAASAATTTCTATSTAVTAPGVTRLTSPLRSPLSPSTADDRGSGASGGGGGPSRRHLGSDEAMLHSEGYLRALEALRIDAKVVGDINRYKRR